VDDDAHGRLTFALFSYPIFGVLLVQANNFKKYFSTDIAIVSCIF
jgi:hypothetical protein